MASLPPDCVMDNSSACHWVPPLEPAMLHRRTLSLNYLPLTPSSRARFQPDLFSFNTAIGSCVKSGDWQRALDLLAGMKVEGLTPDVSSYNGAISACAKAGQWRIGLELLAKACGLCSYHGGVVLTSNAYCSNRRGEAVHSPMAENNRGSFVSWPAFSWMLIKGSC